jgi:hypothetical protein
MLLESLFGGLIIGCCVSYCLIRFFEKIPTRSPFLKSVLLSGAALLLVTILIEVPSSLLSDTRDGLHYFLIGALFNALRIFTLGIVIGCLYKRPYRALGDRRRGTGDAGYSVRRTSR